MGLVVSILLVLALAVAFGFLAWRAWRLRQPVLRWIAVVLSGLLALACAFVAIMGSVGFFRYQARHPNPVSNLQASTGADQIARGERLSNLCAGCHSTTMALPLDGSGDSFLGPLGTLYPPNLTPGGSIRDWSDGEVVRAIREGVGRDGRGLIIMPSEVFRYLSDADVQAMVGYLRTQPAVQRQTPPTDMSLLGALIIGFGGLPINVQAPITTPIQAPPLAPTPEYGEYMTNIGGCRVCHGENLSGGTPDFGPPGPNLLPLVSAWSADEFVRTIRTGVDPYGHAMDPQQMPWQETSRAMQDDELRAIHAYIRRLAGQ
jgi:Cytochrome C oxidase, cbb3-type, subunit III